VDDAIGEAFDKVAVMLGLPYPGGPEIERLAKSGDPNRYPFKPGHVKTSPWSFSFSGLKTNVLYTVKGQNQDKSAPPILPPQKNPILPQASKKQPSGTL
jgi:N6-L-threonylcarbamoyladenine synthase